MHILDLRENCEAYAPLAAALLVAAFAEHWPHAWPNLESAMAEVEESLAQDRLSRIALNDDRQLLGWIGGAPGYNGRVWELHPLAVAPGWQGQGIGRALVHDLEAQVHQRGGLTLLVGTDDERQMTSLGGVVLYPDPLRHLAAIRNIHRHPFGFYQKLGFSLVGVIPDANGLGKPDLVMAKRVTDAVRQDTSVGRATGQPVR